VRGVETCRGYLRIDPVELLSSSEFQAMTLAEHGAEFTRLLEECPPASYSLCRYVPTSEREAVARRYGGSPGGVVPVTCPCGATGEIHWNTRPRFVGMDLDHVHPVSRGGKSEAANLQLLCPSCNRSKGARVA
jgi:hypothetical protein